jgi:hypothetical protein
MYIRYLYTYIYIYMSVFLYVYASYIYLYICVYKYDIYVYTFVYKHLYIKKKKMIEHQVMEYSTIKNFFSWGLSSYNVYTLIFKYSKEEIFVVEITVKL